MQHAVLGSLIGLYDRRPANYQCRAVQLDYERPPVLGRNVGTLPERVFRMYAVEYVCAEELLQANWICKETLDDAVG